MPQLPDSGFNRVAPFYDALARLVYGNALEQAQLALLPFVPQQTRVLVIGGGTGWLLEQLLQTGKKLDILYLEAAPAMLQRAERKYSKYKKPLHCHVTFRLGTEQSINPGEQFDVIFTPFLLDLFPPQRLQVLMSKLAAALSPDGQWLFADFWPVQQPAPWWQHLLIRGMYTFFGWLSNVQATQLPDYKAHFDALGFREKYSQPFYGGMVQAKALERVGELGS
ncbi:class I SAM-dependent methyltransferase [Pontibacter chinhatensis]|uniref:Methyltransferase domain-containing protein n=1 Tax=Pontibacter chinhatensis TaxID=1436961 RepID=A0A1I2R3C7_9BACT|nr:class I SAM-dependent methyltransferase [Pontibacter chinhatensis]SFG35032.1 Methyltransferase domain-containing protein [Pontibacter chinhatensis]